jgi:hypothetical protein
MKRRYVVLSLAVVLALALAVPAFGGPTNIVSALTNVKKTATKALKTAKAASAAAASAQATANTAESDATAAGAAAKKAQTTANEGVTAAKNAQTTANTAKGAADAAQASANSAKTAAAAAQAAANAAQATANSKFGSTFTETGNNAGNHTTEGSSSAACPSGTALTGGGYFTGGAGTNQVVATYDGPYGSAWFAILERIPSGASTWQVTAFAQCAKP